MRWHHSSYGWLEVDDKKTGRDYWNFLLYLEIKEVEEDE
jgi:hypothetical protein